MALRTPRITGGPERRSFFRKNVYPANFSRQDPFWDVAQMSIHLEEQCRLGKIKDFVLIVNDEDGIGYTWRGSAPLPTAIGMIEYVKTMLLSKAEY